MAIAEATARTAENIRLEKSLVARELRRNGTERETLEELIGNEIRELQGLLESPPSGWSAQHFINYIEGVILLTTVPPYVGNELEKELNTLARLVYEHRAQSRNSA